MKKLAYTILAGILVTVGLSPAVGQESQVYIKVKKEGKVVTDTSFAVQKDLSRQEIDAVVNKITGKVEKGKKEEAGEKVKHVQVKVITGDSVKMEEGKDAFSVIVDDGNVDLSGENIIVLKNGKDFTETKVITDKEDSTVISKAKRIKVIAQTDEDKVVSDNDSDQKEEKVIIIGGKDKIHALPSNTPAVWVTKKDTVTFGGDASVIYVFKGDKEALNSISVKNDTLQGKKVKVIIIGDDDSGTEIANSKETKDRAEEDIEVEVKVKKNTDTTTKESKTEKSKKKRKS